MYKTKQKVLDFLDMVSSSQSAIAFTGAGISTESGIPDYRSPGSGLWEKMSQSIVSLEGFLNNPKQYYDYALELHPIRSTARPNKAHYMLASFEEKNLLKGIITQNVDGLHYQAGSKHVHELHGSLRQTVCLGCGLLRQMDNIMKRVVDGENPPICDDCKGILKPNAVFFGEPLPRVPWEESVKLTKKCDLFISIGSSLQVSPANTLPNLAVRNKAKLVIINISDTPYDEDASLVIRQKAAKFASYVLDNIK